MVFVDIEKWEIEGEMPDGYCFHATYLGRNEDDVLLAFREDYPLAVPSYIKKVPRGTHISAKKT